jgi:hypothetical protein
MMENVKSHHIDVIDMQKAIFGTCGKFRSIGGEFTKPNFIGMFCQSLYRRTWKGLPRRRTREDRSKKRAAGQCLLSTGVIFQQRYIV